MIENAIGPQKSVGAIGTMPRIAATAVSMMGRARIFAALTSASHRLLRQPYLKAL